MVSPRSSTRTLGVTAAAFLLCVAPGGLEAQLPIPSVLYRESSATALSIPASDSNRTDLLRRIARAHIWTGDIESALATARPLGPWRREVHTDAVCRLLEERRFGDAQRLVEQFPEADRDWALAHVLSRFARPPLSPRPQERAPVDTAGLTQVALTLARAIIPSPDARVDALISIANTLLYRRDTARAVAAFESALSSLRMVMDPDRASSRRLLIANGLGGAGRTDAALALLPDLLPHDRVQAAWGLGRWRDAKDPRVRAELLAIVARIDTVRDVRIRRAQAEGVVYAFNTLGAPAVADSVAAPLGADPTTGRQSRQPSSATPSIVERAERLAAADFPAAVALVDTLGDPFAYGRRARALVRVTRAAAGTKVDMIAQLLRRARESAVASGLSTRQSSKTLLEIAEAQIGRGLVEDGAATLNAIPDHDLALSVFGHLGGWRFTLSKADGQRFLAGIRDHEVRAAAATRVIGPWLESKDASEADVAWATSVVDALPQVRSAEAAQIMVARNAFFRGDTVAARARLRPVLRARDRDWTRWPTYPFGDDLFFWLARADAAYETLAWVRALPSPASRAAGLLAMGDAVDAVGDLNNLAVRLHNGLQGCRDEF